MAPDWQGGGGDDSGAIADEDNEASWDATSREPITPIRAS